MKSFYFFVLLMLGFFLTPGYAFACGNTPKKNHATTEITLNKDKKNCCDANGHCEKEKHHSCDGNCKHSKCICTASSAIFLVFAQSVLKINDFDFSDKNQKFNTPETFISSGFSSLFLKPKIG
ncbi:hypothetical protein IRZ83_13425 [Flavobacterium sp. JLP]|uniref:hypothetical protein n=1 Tax=Flavobacterium sp. JLP TaxID=2783793 RepID=UPI00188A9E1A|nr:hypothetical protein [Flavobacterium sp. JLP]MBF4507671.1 hypothetical protein [Flavobacterium sp. JLP]